MQEEKKTMKEKCIKAEDVKIPPIDEIHGLNIPPDEEIHGLDNPTQEVCFYGYHSSRTST